jgi:hypothetical protein
VDLSHPTVQQPERCGAPPRAPFCGFRSVMADPQIRETSLIFAAAAVEPPMFIGFSLVEDVERPSSTLFPNSQKPADIH